MRHVLKTVLGLTFGLGVLFAVGGGDEAQAQCCAPPPPCCAPPPPPCCAPPAPPPCCAPPAPPTPPSTPCCAPPGHSINVPGVNVNVHSSVIVNANVNAQVTANAMASGSGSGRGSSTVFFGGGGFGGGIAPGPVSMIPSLNVEGGREKRRVAFEARREKTVRVVIQAFCLDERQVPHPASQVSPDKDIDESFEGELYRCLAGTRMQYVVAEYLDRVSFDGGKTVTCEKNQALWRGRGGVLECRRQQTARECNERSLLRRFGAGIKILTIRTVETYTDYREEYVETASSSSSSMTLTGGVGGVAY